MLNLFSGINPSKCVPTSKMDSGVKPGVIHLLNFSEVTLNESVFASQLIQRFSVFG